MPTCCWPWAPRSRSAPSDSSTITTKWCASGTLGLTPRAKFSLQVLTCFVVGVVLLSLQDARRVFDAAQRAVFQTPASESGDRLRCYSHPLHLAAGVRAVRAVSGAGDRGLFERGESHRRPGRPGHRLRAGFVHRAHRADLPLQQRALRRLSRHSENSRCRRTGHVLRLAGRRVARFSLVQRASGGNVHGRRRLAGAGRRHRHRRGDHQAGNSCCSRSAACS